MNICSFTEGGRSALNEHGLLVPLGGGANQHCTGDQGDVFTQNVEIRKKRITGDVPTISAVLGLYPLMCFFENS